MNKPAKKQKPLYPTHLSPAERTARILKQPVYMGTGYTDREGADKTRRISKAAI